MIKIALVSLLIVFSSISIPVLSLELESESTIENNNIKNWTWMFYNDADFKDGYNPLNDFCLEAFSGINLSVIVLEDPNNGPANIWKISEKHEKILLEEFGEVNMGCCRTLERFIEYCKENYPAERYLLSVYDHGSAWKGACIDKTNFDSNLKMNGFQTALDNTDGVDIICFTAPCLMGSIESVYEIRDCVDVYIGSEELSSYSHWLAVIDDICEILNNETTLSNYEIGERIIYLIENNEENYPEWHENLTMSAIRTDKIEDLVESINNLSKNIIKSKLFTTISKIKTAKEITKKFIFVLSDLYNFTENLQKIEGLDQTIYKDLENIQKNFNQTVIAECHGISQKGSNGLTIYFPDKFFTLRAPGFNFFNYRIRFNKLDFVKNTYWDEFLFFYLLIS